MTSISRVLSMLFNEKVQLSMIENIMTEATRKGSKLCKLNDEYVMTEDGVVNNYVDNLLVSYGRGTPVFKNVSRTPLEGVECIPLSTLMAMYQSALEIAYGRLQGSV